ncbi:Phosphatidylserine decarboxylase proenzyme [bacterium HR36]|nr:Phosphatidylserine decarboxylase proenzyme [bacterium HR36]
MSEKDLAGRSPAVITSVQPGGGWCMSLDLAWGRLRRTWLRWFRPHYVAQMQQQRQGHCENCPHEVVDYRDLKYYRNVCGYRFGKDDHYTRPGRVPLAPLGLCEIVVASLVAAGVVALSLFGWYRWNWASWLSAGLSGIAALAWCQTLWFFRDPERPIPQEPGILVSPADGLVTHVDVVPDPDFPEGRALRISIFLSIFDVHINRTPCTGRVIDRRYYPGRFGNALWVSVAESNEQFWTDLEESETGQRIRVKQIAGAIARRIVNWLRAGEQVERGQRIGLIKFGSRTDLLVPVNGGWEARVGPGQRVYGGTTILLSRQKSLGS